MTTSPADGRLALSPPPRENLLVAHGALGDECEQVAERLVPRSRSGLTPIATIADSFSLLAVRASKCKIGGRTKDRSRRVSLNLKKSFGA